MDVNGQVQMIISFLSPVTPDDYVRQSLPMSYMQVSVISIDGREHSVQLYSDISAGEFVNLFQKKAKIVNTDRVGFWHQRRRRTMGDSDIR